MKVTLIDKMGDDIRVANAARVSFDKESEYYYDPINDIWYVEGRDTRLIKYLADHDHWTPFAHCQATMRVEIPIFLARQWFKHMVGFVYNEVSRRYVDSPPEFYTPIAWRKEASNKKQGSSDELVVQMEFSNGVEMWTDDVDNFYQSLLSAAEDTYWAMRKAGICPEQARMVLPQSMYTSFYCTGSLAAWARLYNQRVHGNAQKEWEEVLPQIDEIMKGLFPHSWKALTSA